jgi:hypothetical protein
MILKTKGHKCSTLMISALLIFILATTTARTLSIDTQASMTITIQTDEATYLLRQKVTMGGDITLGGAPADNLVTPVEVTDPLDTALTYRTLQIGNPTQMWSISITNMFLCPVDNINPMNTVKTNSQVRVKVTFSNLQLTARTVYMTFTAFDANMVPLGASGYTDTIDPGQSSYPTFALSIPSWACPGQALLTANAYTSEPKAGGLALSPELASYFCISRTEQGLLQYPTLPPPPPQATPGVYSTYITLPPDPRAGQYKVYAIGQAGPATFSTASTSFNVQDSTGYPPQTSFVYSTATPDLNVTVNFDASSSTPEGAGDKITKYTWSFGDGTPNTVKTGNPPDPTADHAYQHPGTFTIILNVTDNEGLWCTASKPISVTPGRTWPTANFTWSPEYLLINETITFNGSSSTTGWSDRTQSYSPIQNYTWSFGDGTSRTTLTPITTYNYTSTGSYVVQLTIVDADGRTAMTEASLQVLNNTIKIYDFNGDGIIDMKDIRRVAKAFGATPGSPHWDPVVDTNGDGIIDMKDIRGAAKNFGKDP